MTLGAFSCDLETALRDVSCSHFCNISTIDYNMVTSKDVIVKFGVSGYGYGVSEIKEIYEYLQQYFTFIGYSVVGSHNLPADTSNRQSVESLFFIKLDLLNMHMCLKVSQFE